MKTGSTVFLAFVSFVVGIHVVDAAPADAGAIVRDSGIDRGLCVILDVGDGALAAQLAKQGKFVVHGIATTDEATRRAREHIASQGLYGRVSVEKGDLARLPYVSELANLVVVEDGARALKNGLDLKEAARILRPGGVAWLQGGKEAAAGLAGVELMKSGGDAALVRKMRAATTDDWTHWLHGPECNSLSSDDLAGPAARLQWLDGPIWPTGRMVTAVFASGRGFCVMQGANGLRTPTRLIARDSGNGLILWERILETGKDGCNPRVIVAEGDRLFAVLKKDGPLVALDAESGKENRAYDVGFSPGSVFFVDGNLILGSPQEICSVNADTGTVRWRRRAATDAPFRYESDVSYGQYPYMVIGGGKLFVFVKDAARPSYTLLCCDVATGDELWKQRHPGELLKWYEGTLALLDQPEPFSWKKKVLGTIRGISPADGRKLWEQPNVALAHSDANTACTSGLFWINEDGKGLKGLDPATGQVKREFKGSVTGHCGFVKTTDRYFIGVYDSFLDVASGKRSSRAVYKNACGIGQYPADGLIHNFPVNCICRPYLRGFMAFAPRRTAEADANAERLQKGPAYGMTPVAEKSAGWRTYRHDPRRSGGTDETLPPRLSLLWSEAVNPQPRTAYGKSITPPTVADGMVFVGAPDAVEVRALDAKTGETRWRFLPDGRVEVPPTIHNGLCLFGANDGYVYCLRASDGALVWRFRAAEEDQRIMALGRLESPWPVPGVLVVNDVAFFSAGRHGKSPDGVFAFAADPFTGKVKWTRRVSDQTFNVNDLLVASGDTVAMTTLFLDQSTGEDRKIDWKTVRYLRSGQHTYGGGYGLMPLGFLYDRKDGAENEVRYYRTYWSFLGILGLTLSFDDKTVYGVAPRGREWAVFAMPPDGAEDPKKLPDPVWSQTVPFNSVKALLPTRDALYVAGPAKEGGALTWYSKSDGEVLGDVTFADAPVFDGMAAADGRLYIATQNGKVFCFGEK